MKYQTLGNTGLNVSIVGFGAWAIGGSAYKGYGQSDDSTAMLALNKAYELGCTLFDTADVYGLGRSEVLLGRALKGWCRDEVVIATKGGYDFSSVPEPFISSITQLGDQPDSTKHWDAVRQNFSEKHLRMACENSLRRLGIEAIDLYQLHSPSIELIQLAKEPQPFKTMFDVLRDLQQEGKIRHLGISIHDPQEGIQAIEFGQVEVVQAVYNLIDRRAEHALFEACQKAGTGLMIREPFARGFLSGSYEPNRKLEKTDNRSVWPKPLIQKRVDFAEYIKKNMPEGYPDLGTLALQFALSPKAAHTVIPGCKTPEQVTSNLLAASYPELTHQDRQVLIELLERYS